jgi:glycosyltransferase involved in cell wall biosynthesis
MGFPGRPVHVVPNGVDVAARPPAETPGTGFLYAGRLSDEKGVGTLVRAVADRPELSLSIAGDGPLAGALRVEAEERAPGRVRFLGHLGAAELESAMRGARAVVLPSEWYENAPMTALEAAASGVPVIGARIGGIPEIVRSGTTGLLFEPGDATGLAAAMARLEADPDEAVRLGRAARGMAEREYGLDRQVETMLGILEEVASSASR